MEPRRHAAAPGWRALHWCWRPWPARQCSSWPTSGCRSPIPALALSTLMSAGGLLLSALPAWLVWHRHPPPASRHPCAGRGGCTTPWVPTAGGFLLWYAGSARTSGVRASLATVWLPVAALLLSVVFLGESIPQLAVAGPGLRGAGHPLGRRKARRPLSDHGGVSGRAVQGRYACSAACSATNSCVSLWRGSRWIIGRDCSCDSLIFTMALR